MADNQPITSHVTYKEIPGFPAYRVGDDGSVWTRRVKGSNHGRLGLWKLMKPLPISDSGRFKVALRRDGQTFWFAIHRLVLEAFVGPCPIGLEACHRDDNPANNKLDNLRWDTHLSNCEDRSRNGIAAGKYQKTVAINTAREALRQRVQEIRRLDSIGMTYWDIARAIGISYSAVYRIVTGRSRASIA